MASFRFCETYLLHIRPFVVNKSAISPFLGGESMCHSWMSARVTHECVIPWMSHSRIHVWISHVTFMDQGICGMTHSYNWLWTDSFIRDTCPHNWFIHVNSTHRHIRVTRRIHTCDMTHLYMWHDASINVTWQIHACEICTSAHTDIHTRTHTYMNTDIHKHIYTHIYAHRYTQTHIRTHVHTRTQPLPYGLLTFIRLTWLIHTCDITYSYMSHDVFIHTYKIHTHIHRLIHTCVPTHSYTHTQPLPTCVVECWFVHTCDITHSYMWHDPQKRCD